MQYVHLQHACGAVSDDVACKSDIKACSNVKGLRPTEIRQTRSKRQTRKDHSRCGVSRSHAGSDALLSMDGKMHFDPPAGLLARCGVWQDISRSILRVTHVH